jgi:prophage maintenance system killer protein/prophage antirepressor-like protein
MKATSEIVIYDGGEARVEVRVEHENVWLSLQQLADLFGRDKSVISRHLRNIFASGELDREATVAKNATVQREGEREVVRDIEYFNLDVIISVGYRVNSTRATRFRQWATRVLREHLTQGYSLDRQRFEHNAAELEAALALVKKAAAGETLTAELGRGLVDVIARYTQTFLWLQRYDEGLLAVPTGSPGGVLPTLAQAHAAIARLKADLMARDEASDLFGRERGDAFAAILGNLEQTVFGEPAYPSVEAKAAHLLYFVIKNHPFSDGNKRSGAFLFVDFLARNGRLIRNGAPVINDVGLAALALLVAESDARNKDVMIRLIENMLALSPVP